MRTGRRLATLLVVVGLIGAPAIALSLACAGQSCSQPEVVSAEVPFCPLPADLRNEIGNGYYKGRSADVFAVPRDDSVGSWSGEPEPTGAAYTWPWPGLTEGDAEDLRVPLAFWGQRIQHQLTYPAEPMLSSVAPTLAAVMDLERPHPEVRSGEAVDGVVSTGAPPRLVLIVAVKGMGWNDVRKLPESMKSTDREGYLTKLALPGSLPVDSATALTTAGVGALASEHGVTGSVLRTDQGGLAQAWGRDAPGSTLATLADDLLQAEPEAVAGMVGTSEQDRGLVGNGWYLGGRIPGFEVAKAKAVPAAFERMLDSGGFGADSTPDLIAAAIPVGGSDRVLGELIAAAEAASAGHLTVAVFGTGTGGPARMDAVQADEVVRQVEELTGTPGIVSLATSGGFFIDEQVAADSQTSSGEVVEALKRIRGPDGKRLFADAFPAFSIQFERYC